MPVLRPDKPAFVQFSVPVLRLDKTASRTISSAPARPSVRALRSTSRPPPHDPARTHIRRARQALNHKACEHELANGAHRAGTRNRPDRPKPVRTGTNRHTHQRKACQPPAARAALWRGIAAMRVEDTRRRRMERETGIEPATNSLEGCDSTTELLPPTLAPRASARQARLDPQSLLQRDKLAFARQSLLSAASLP